MRMFGSPGAKALWGAILILPLLFTGCADIEPYQPRDYREEGLEKGLFTGSEGEFVIFRKADEPANTSEDGKEPDGTADTVQQKK